MIWKKTEHFKETEFGPMKTGHTIEHIDCSCDKPEPMPRRFVIDSISLQAFEIQGGGIFVEYRGTPPRNPIYVTQDSKKEGAE